MLKTMITTALVSAAAVGLSACDVRKTQEGNVSVPKYEVEKKAEGDVTLPKYDVKGPDVQVGSKQTTVNVPDVDVRAEKKTITVPDVDVKTGGEKRAEESTRQMGAAGSGKQ